MVVWPTLVWEGVIQQGEEFNTDISRLVEATAGHVASRASGESSPTPKSKLWLLLRRLEMRCIHVHGPHKIPRDFVTWLPPSRLAALRHKEAYIGRLGR
jgi:hypothetical protein